MSNNEQRRKKYTPEELSNEAEKAQFNNVLKARLYKAFDSSSVSGQKSKFMTVASTSPDKKRARIAQPASVQPPSLRKKVPEDPELNTILKRASSVEDDIMEEDDLRDRINFRSNIADEEMSSSGRKTKSGKLRPISELSTTVQSQQETSSVKRSPFPFIIKIKKQPQSLEFVYLNRITQSETDPYNPYSLEVVSHSQVNKEDYYTMSANGVTHFVDGDVDYTTLEQWEKEHHLFHKMLQIPFFKMYRRWKTFYFMRQRVIQKRSTRANAALKAKLFLLGQTLTDPLTQIRKLCLEVTSIKLFQDNSGIIMTLEEFVKMQDHQRMIAVEKLQSIMQRVTEIVLTACKEFMIKAGFGDKFKDINEMNDFDPLTEQVVANANATTTSPRYGKHHQAPVSYGNDEPYQMSYTELSQKRAACKRLMNFIRLVDYLILDALVQLNYKSVEEILKKVTFLAEHSEGAASTTTTEQEVSHLGAPENDTTPLFKTEVILSDEDLLIIPARELFEKRVDKVIKDFLSAIKVERLLTKKEFEEFLEPVLNDRGEEVKIGEGPNLKFVITREDSYGDLVSNIKETLNSNFKEVEKYASFFEPLRSLYLENKRMNIKTIHEQDPPLEFFREEMKKYKIQREKVEGMNVSKNKGLFHVDTTKLKQMFLPSPKECLQSIHELLPVLAREKNDDLHKQLVEAVRKLRQSTTSVDDFVEYLQFVEYIAVQVEVLEEKFKVVDEIYKLMEDERINVPAIDKDKFSTETVSIISQLRKAIALAEETKEDRINKFSVDLIRRFDDIRMETQDVQEKSREAIVSSETAEVEVVIAYLQDLKDKVDAGKKRAKQLSDYQEKFKLTVSEVPEIEEVKVEVELKLKLWQSLKDWMSLTDSWTNTKFNAINMEDLSKNIDHYYFSALQVQKGLKENPVVPKLLSLVEHWKLALPVIQDLKNPSLKRNRHWRQIDEIIGKPLSHDPNLEFPLKEIMDPRVVEKRKEIEEISQQASNEAALEEMLKNVKKNWDRLEYEVMQYKDGYVLGTIDDIKTQLEDDQITVSMIASSPYVTAIKAEVQKWEEDLKQMYDTLNQWKTCQQKWRYLESVFSGSDILSQLKAESPKLFNAVDRFFKETMKRTNEVRNVKRASIDVQPGLLDKFKMHNEHLEKLEKSLEKHLEEKRNSFARFYFLSNDDLLDILSQSKNPQAVLPHLEKFFEGMKSLKFEGATITAMISKEEEIVPLTPVVKGDGVITRMKGLESSMVATLLKATKASIEDYVVREREQWLFEHPSQVVLTVSQIFWSREIQKCLEAENPLKELHKYLDTCKEQLNKLAGLTRSDLLDKHRKTVCTLIILEVHGRDVLEKMIEDGVSSPSDFGWLKQLRYYWDEKRAEREIANGVNNNICMVKQSNSEFRYGCEYLGCMSRLVITPLTDRVFMTLTGALYLNLGGAPAGPAGTGKTESVKDLAKALAVPCIVYNCSDGVTYEMMYKFFSGIVQTGSWACFDEFNRINVEVLSVIASQLQTIQDALKAKKERFFLEDDKEIDLKHSCGVFITMNPGYAGRAELPDNLKALFRPVAVMIPDYGLISEVTLFSEGYVNARVLSRKMVQLYKLSNEQLSNQDHYDFGMRAMKSVLVMAGKLKRKAAIETPNASEDETLMRAMKDSNVPKFVADDVTLFEAIVSDLFPTVNSLKPENLELETALKEKMREKGLEPVPAFIRKIVQFYDTLIVRHGVMLVGPTGSGKTTNRDLFAEAAAYLRKVKQSRNSTYRVIQQFAMNPKSITYGELYGTFNLDTHAWYDGLLAFFARKAVKDTSDDDKWIVFDGPVDTLWIESMNSVLDDSKLLCLDNTERIQITERVKFVFEVQDLAVASPATVSRCGMVYMDPNELGWLPSVKAWIRKLPSGLMEHQEYILKLFEEYMPATLGFIRSNCKEEVPSVNVNLVTSLCNLFKALSKKYDWKKNAETVNSVLDSVFMFSLIWSVGGNIVGDSKPVFEKYIRDNFKKICTIPANASIYDYCIDFETTTFVEWATYVPEFTYSPNMPYFQIMVPTIDTYRFSYLLKVISEAEKPILFNGKTGVGKTAIISNTYSSDKENSAIELVTLQFSAQTSSKRTQESIESKLVLRKNVLKAPPGKKVVLFIDDINMPQQEVFGASPPIELLRQLIGYNGFYDIADKVNFTWKQVEDVTVIAACGPPGGGRNSITPRLLRMFHLINIPEISEDNLRHIFSSILTQFLRDFSEEIQTVSQSVVRAAVQLYERVSDLFRPKPSCAHYTFNLRDLSKVFQGILQVTPETTKTAKTIVKLWAHESVRCFYDRLNNIADREQFKELVVEMNKRHFKSIGIPDEEFFESPLLFGDFLSSNIAERKYEQITNTQKLTALMDDYLMGYNMKYTPKMDLVFFPDATMHTSRIARILRQQRGNALLVGVGGSGKQSLTRLAASMLGYSIFEIKLRRNYQLSDFREDIRKLYRQVGLESQPVVFIFSDSQMINDSFLEDVNNILNSGEVPNLFEAEDKEKIINEIRPKAKEAGVPDTRDAVFAYFINRVRDNLHIVLCMSPVGDNFRDRIRKFPSLVNCSTIDWFDEWPQEALRLVAERKFARVNLGSEELRETLTDLSVKIHVSATEFANKFYQEMRRKYYITPASFLEFIQLFSDYLEKKKLELNHARDELKRGLLILKSTNEIVQVLKKEVEEARPVLQQKAKEADATAKEVAEITLSVEQQRALIAKEEATLNEKTQKANEVAEEARKEMEQATPMLTKAIKALDALDKGDIAEIKKYKIIAESVKLVLTSVLILRGEKDTSWGNVIRVISEPNFVSQCMAFDKDNMKTASVDKVKKLMKDPNFDEQKVESTSRAAKSLCTWVIALVRYHDVKLRIEPLEQALKKAYEEKEELSKALKKKQDELSTVENQYKELNDKLERTKREKKELEEKVAIAGKRFNQAEKLINSLIDEYDRWTQSVAVLEKKISNIPGNMFLSTACVVYFGAFDSAYRKQIIAAWETLCRENEVPMSDDTSIEKILSTPVEVREWGINGLPTDNHSVQNAVLVTVAKDTSRWPLLIDPQGQGNAWVKSMEKVNGLKVIKFSGSNQQQLDQAVRQLDQAIRAGQPVLIEDLGETIDASLEQLLQKQPSKGNKGSRVYLSTKIANPHYLPEVCNKFMLVNFTVTVKGLEDQLLAEVIKKLLPEKEAEKDRLVVSVADDRKQLDLLEKQILQKLGDVGDDNILDRDDVIQALDNSKYMSNLIAERVDSSEKQEKEINKEREEYRSVAIRGSILFFVIADLVKVDPMYQNSLEYFKKLFNQCIEVTPKSSNLSELLIALMDNITAIIFKNICRGLFEKDKLVFSFLICVQILRQQGEILDEEWFYFLRSSVLEKAKTPNPVLWLTEKAWNFLHNLESTFPIYQGISEAITKRPETWKSYCSAPNPYIKEIPDNFSKKLKPFQQLLLIKVLREEKLMYSSSAYVTSQLGETFTKSLALDLKQTLADSNAATPIIFILSQGADPTDLLKRFAQQNGFESKFAIKSLGQGQEQAAMKQIDRGRKYGEWVLLQNCHLAKSFLPELERIINDFSSPTASLHPDFRLWLTSMPDPSFPIPILQNSVKLTNEPPKGIRANIVRTYKEITEDLFESFNPAEQFAECDKALAFKKLMFGLSLFHAIIQERRKFGPLGWTNPYEFNDSDLTVAQQWLKIFLKEQSKIPWDSLKYVIGEIVYGGRVTDPWDRRCILDVLNFYFGKEILDQNFKFSGNAAYLVPHGGTLEIFREFVDRLPTQDEPELFCMHENANIVSQLQESNRMLMTVSSMQPRSSTSSSSSSNSDDAIKTLAHKILEELPKELDKSEAGPTTFTTLPNGTPHSLSTVLSHEMLRFNKLLRQMRRTLEELLKAMDGLVLLSADLEKMLYSLYNNEVPDLWEKAGFLSMKPLGAWIEDLHQRVNFFRNWLKNGLPKCFWLSGFFFPQGFLTGVLQTYARKYKVAIDKLSFSFRVLKEYDPSEIVNPPEDGVLVHGIYLDGAKWDAKSMTVTDADVGKLVYKLPIIHFLPEQDHKLRNDVYNSPLYKTSVRKGTLSSLGQSTNFVVAIELPTVKQPSYWTLQGVACLSEHVV